MHTRNKPFSFLSRNYNRSPNGGVSPVNNEESSQDEFEMLGRYSVRYNKPSGYKPPWVRGVKTVRARPKSALRTPYSTETDSKPCMFERPSTSPIDKSLISNMYSTLISSEYQTDNEVLKCKIIKEKYETYDLSDDSESDMPESSVSSVSSARSIKSNEAISKWKNQRIFPQRDITCGISRVCRDKDAEKTKIAQSYINDCLSEFSDGFESIDSLPVDKKCLKYRESNKCQNPCFPEGVNAEILSSTSGIYKTKIYSILEGYHKNHCHCTKDYNIDEDPLLSLLLGKKRMAENSRVRLNDYNHLMSQAFKYIYPSAYTPSRFKYTLKPRVVKHIKDLDSFEKFLIGKSDGLSLSDDDRDIARNLRIDEETKFMAAYNAAEMAARMTGCKADEVETSAWMEKDYDVHISPVKNVPIPSNEEEKQIEVIGYVGITRPHDSGREKTRKSHLKKNKTFTCPEKRTNCNNSEFFFDETD